MDAPKYEIEGELLQKVISYMATKPYGEVFQLISDVQTKAKLIEKPAEKITKPSKLDAQ
jgi:hypothetical protein